jgi:hypothetical protein
MYIPPIPSKRAAVITIPLRATQKKDMSKRDEDFCNTFV